MNSVAYLPQSKRLLDQVREVLRYKHYSLKTEQAYLYWIRFYVRWHGRDGEMQHPRAMGGHRSDTVSNNARQRAACFGVNTQPAAQRVAIFVSPGFGNRFAVADCVGAPHPCETHSLGFDQDRSRILAGGHGWRIGSAGQVAV